MEYLPTYAGEGVTVYVIEKGRHFSVCEKTNNFDKLDKNNDMLENCTLAFYLNISEKLVVTKSLNQYC